MQTISRPASLDHLTRLCWYSSLITTIIMSNEHGATVKNILADEIERLVLEVPDSMASPERTSQSLAEKTKTSMTLESPIPLQSSLVMTANPKFALHDAMTKQTEIECFPWSELSTDSPETVEPCSVPVLEIGSGNSNQRCDTNSIPAASQTHSAERPNWALAPKINKKPRTQTKANVETGGARGVAQRNPSSAPSRRQSQKSNLFTKAIEDLSESRHIPQQERANKAGGDSSSKPWDITRQRPSSHLSTPQDAIRANSPAGALTLPGDWATQHRNLNATASPIVPTKRMTSSNSNMESYGPSRPFVPRYAEGDNPTSMVDRRNGGLGDTRHTDAFTSAFGTSEFQGVSIPVIVNTWSNLPRQPRYEEAPRSPPISPEVRGMHFDVQQTLSLVSGPEWRVQGTPEGFRGSIPEMRSISHAPSAYGRGPGGLDRTFPAQGYGKLVPPHGASSPYHHVELPPSNHRDPKQLHMNATMNHVTRGVSHNIQLPNGPYMMNSNRVNAEEFARNRG
ncbi:hypothetical protein D9611_002508 [Ephemerocybe angulata]|uniref:Uncharacterized protein n=1 Tax=Ephemerocybe angulata TaxID=980116 RepID=A0A8H5C1W3_9AGAR|nr:hypothetical protein D9611_002508 [Tulosesus angulatus]